MKGTASTHVRTENVASEVKPPRFLFFLYYYPPFPGTPSRRNFQISSEIAKRAAFSLVYTATKQPISTDNNKLHPVETIPTLDYRSILRKNTADGALPERKKSNIAMQALVKIINTFPINIIIGEGGLIYFYSLLRKGQRAIRKHGITHIYSSYRPFSDHYAAYILKRRNPGIVWVADFRDLIIDPHYRHIFFPFFHKLFFKRIFKKADLLTTVSNGLAKHLLAYQSNVITLRNGIVHFPEIVREDHCKYFKIAYTGSMFLDKRNAEPVFKALKELVEENLIERDNVRILYAGKDSEYWIQIAAKTELDSILIDKGIIGAEEANTIQKNACINLLLTVASEQLEGVLTGKMIEYFEAGSPILAIVVNKNDPELSALLVELEIGKSFSDQKIDFSATKEFIYIEYLHWKKTGTNRKPVNLKILKDTFAVESTMKPLFEKLNIEQSSS